jgi:hypothetical protein
MPPPPRQRFALLLLAVGLATRLTAQGPYAADVIAEYARLGAQPLWPGFRPAAVPIAVFDGDTTWLSGHPNPPAEFTPGPVPGLFRLAGRHPLVDANSSVELGGVTTATLLLDRSRAGSASEWAATLLHEAFHVYQRTHHTDWPANEAELFTYPWDQEAPQRLQRLETEAWRRAVTRQQPACWARTALEYRKLRFSLLPVGAAAYERGTELNEGLATYVQFQAEHRDSIPFPARGFTPDDVRLRGYAVGPAIARLLDRFQPRWRDQLERGPTKSLDEMLAGGLAPGEPCRYPAAEEDSIRRLARSDIEAARAGRIALRDSVLSAPGWRVEVVADSGHPLWSERFDPWNIVPVGEGAIVHRRFLRLSKDGLSVEIINRTTLTEPAGNHPLFNGIRRLLVSGLADEPSIQELPGKVVVTGEGVRIEGRVRSVRRQECAIRLEAGP